MSGHQLIQLKNALVNRAAKTPKTHWEDGNYDDEHDDDKVISRIIIAVRRTKTKNQPFAIDV